MMSWIAFSDRMPAPAFDRAHPDRPTHGKILVTNNIFARDRWGKMSHVWLVGRVYDHPDGPREFAGETHAEKGEITALAGGILLRGLTHWRPAVPEEWGAEFKIGERVTYRQEGELIGRLGTVTHSASDNYHTWIHLDSESEEIRVETCRLAHAEQENRE